jgi:hypothetical protein
LPSTVLFTNGDNDILLQEVERIRDVCVFEPRRGTCGRFATDCRPELTDQEIAALRPTIDSDGSLHLVKDFAVEHILAVSPPERPLYLAVTVPDRMGLDDARRLTMEGLANRIHREPTPSRIDVDICRRNVMCFITARGIRRGHD